MRGITLWQPYAQAIFTANPVLEGAWAKKNETRSWALPNSFVGEELFIHAAQRVLTSREVSRELEDECHRLWGPWRATLGFGEIIGTVVFNFPFTTNAGGPAHDYDRIFGDWTPGRWAWPVVTRRKLETPIKAKGKQGWWSHDV